MTARKPGSRPGSGFDAGNHVAIALTCAGTVDEDGRRRAHVLIRCELDLRDGSVTQHWPKPSTPPRVDDDGPSRSTTWRSKTWVEYSDDTDTPRTVKLECFACVPRFEDRVTVGHVRAVLDRLRSLGEPRELHLTCAGFHDVYRRLRGPRRRHGA